MTTNEQTPKQAIDVYIAEYLKPFLKQEGFLKHGRTWVKDGDGFSFIINVQANKWNALNHTPEFYVNYGVFAASLYEEYFRMPIPNQPMEYDCVLRYRLLDKKANEVWKVQDSQVVNAIKEQSLKLFDEIQSIDDIKQRREKQGIAS